MKRAKSLKIAHLSDLHFGSLSADWRDWLSKGWIAQLNYLLNIHRRFDFKLLRDLPAFLRDESVDAVLISGDFTTAGGEHEHRAAAAFVAELLDQQLPCLHIPGNHDHYVRRDEGAGYFSYLYSRMSCACDSSNHSLFADRFELRDLPDKVENPWRIWLLDQCLPTSWISSGGEFDAEALSCLSAAMKNESRPGNWLVCGHFPLHSSLSRHRNLKGRSELSALLNEHQNVRFYLHGHTHQAHLFDERPEQTFLASDAGSCTQRRRATFNIYELQPQSALVRCMKSSSESQGLSWQEVSRMAWSWAEER